MYDVIIIGGGPAGLMAGITIKNKKVLLIDKNERVGKKLSISGGGRCNLTNNKPLNLFLNEIPVNSKTLYSTLTNFGPKEIMAYFSNLGIKLKVEDNERVFPISNNSYTIIEVLEKELIKNKVELKLKETVKNIEISDDRKVVTTDKGKYETLNIIVATGGFSYPMTGSTGDGYRLAKKLNQSITKVYPAETYIKLNGVSVLSGITLDNVKVTFNKKTAFGPLLFTHIGLSGPTIFKLSGDIYNKIVDLKKVEISIDFIPNINEEDLLIQMNDTSKEINTFFKEYIPKKVVDFLFKDYINIKINTINNKTKKQIINNIKNYIFEVIGTGSLEESIVTGGGVDMKEINSKTFESKIYKGLYFVGEVLDIHGNTGGYNITLALSTGYSAALDINNRKDLI